MARRGDGIYQRGRTWWLDFTHGGERHFVRLGRNIKRHVAAELAQVKRAEVLKGVAGIGGPKRVDLPFAQAAEDFMTWTRANKRPRTARHYGLCVARLKESFGSKRLGELSPFDVERHKKARVDAGAAVGVNRELAVLKALYNRARDWGKYDGPNPVTRVRPVKESDGRLRFLEPDEETALLEAAAREPLRSIILAGLYAGLRVASEALTLRWEDVDLRRGLVTVQAAYAKSGKTRSVPLHPKLKAALVALRPAQGAASGYVFTQADGSPYTSIRTAFDGACKRAKLKDVTPHTLRHTFASRLVMGGVDLRTVQELGGWRTLAMVLRYAHLTPAHKRDAIEKLTAVHSPTVSTTPERAATDSAVPAAG